MEKVLGCGAVVESMGVMSELPEITIWVCEQLDPSGLLYACIACCDQAQGEDCQRSFEANLTPEQQAAGWFTRLRPVQSWDEVPATALKLG